MSKAFIDTFDNGIFGKVLDGAVELPGAALGKVAEAAGRGRDEGTFTLGGDSAGGSLGGGFAAIRDMVSGVFKSDVASMNGEVDMCAAESRVTAPVEPLGRVEMTEVKPPYHATQNDIYVPVGLPDMMKGGPAMTTSI